jgi:hypothetical protein
VAWRRNRTPDWRITGALAGLGGIEVAWIGAANALHSALDPMERRPQ